MSADELRLLHAHLQGYLDRWRTLPGLLGGDQPQSGVLHIADVCGDALQGSADRLAEIIETESGHLVRKQRGAVS